MSSRNKALKIFVISLPSLLIGFVLGVVVIATFWGTLTKITRSQEAFIYACGRLNGTKLSDNQYLFRGTNGISGYCTTQRNPLKKENCTYENFLRAQTLVGHIDPITDIVFSTNDPFTWGCRVYTQNGVVINASAFRNSGND